MFVRKVWLGMAMASLAVAARANDTIGGAYVCTVEQKAGIAAEQLEGADPPTAFLDKRVTRFRIVVTPPAKNARANATFRVEETSYSGPERDKQIWQTKDSVLHGTYRGDGWKFAAVDDQAFLRLDFIGEAGWLWFYHAGFERADDDHLSLSVRAGPCQPNA